MATDLRTDETNDARMARLRAAEPTKLEWLEVQNVSDNTMYESVSGVDHRTYVVFPLFRSNRVTWVALIKNSEKFLDGNYVAKDFLSPEAARMACERYETLLRRGERP